LPEQADKAVQVGTALEFMQDCMVSKGRVIRTCGKEVDCRGRQ
jgi:hypothetical protein